MLRSLAWEDAAGLVLAAFGAVVLGARVVCGVVLLPLRPFVPWAKSTEQEKLTSIKTIRSLLIRRFCKFGSEDS